VAALSVLRPGMLSTVQDRGRWGHQHLGVPVAGPMDWYSHTLANRLVGNRDDAATVEITLMGPELAAVDEDVACVVCGAEFEVSLGGRRCAPATPLVVRPGERLRFGSRARGARAFLAVAGGIAVPETLGSRATSLTSRMGPFGGRALKAGDVLPVGAPDGAGMPAGSGLVLPVGGTRVRVISGPHDDWFTPHALETFAGARFIVTPESNRMGYRLAGPPLAHAHGADILSDATPQGSIQVPASGQPILLMADRGTTGGYPKIATVITADLPLAGQLAPGDWIEFELCTRAEAAAALRDRMASLRGERA
jgi:antagonist of KipI